MLLCLDAKFDTFAYVLVLQCKLGATLLETFIFQLVLMKMTRSCCSSSTSSSRCTVELCTIRSPWNTVLELSSFECYLFRSVRTILVQLCSGHCRLLNSYKAHITAGATDVCPDCGVAPHSVEHLFRCPACPTQLTTRDLWDNPDVVADFLKLDDS